MSQAFYPNVNGYVGYAYPIPPPPKPKPGLKPVNVFSNDGSFLDRIQRSMKEVDEKRKREEELERKRNFDNRFRNRGKRSPPATADSTLADPPTKKQKSDNTSVKTEYQKLVENHSGRNIKGNGAGGHTLTQ
ncbi:hypothetical protein F5146DRAFT_1226089 [Armillaria mellea]|nr:hypothetical protein F5146DRAFT_1226089 [Armillaria mellea]